MLSPEDGSRHASVRLETCCGNRDAKIAFQAKTGSSSQKQLRSCSLGSTMAPCYNTFPKTSNTAATANTSGHSLIGTIELWRPTMKVHPPMTMQKPATAHTTTRVTGSLAPPTSVTSATSAADERQRQPLGHPFHR